MFITLAFLLRNTYFNIIINLHIYKPGGGFEKLSLSLLRQLKKILVPCVDPSHPTHTSVISMEAIFDKPFLQVVDAWGHDYISITNSYDTI